MRMGYGCQRFPNNEHINLIFIVQKTVHLQCSIATVMLSVSDGQEVPQDSDRFEKILKLQYIGSTFQNEHLSARI